MEEYAQFGAEIGDAIAATAERLGVAVNDFANTPVGKITILLIVYKLIGETVIGIVVGSVFLIISFSIWFYLFRRMCLIQAIEYGPDGKKTRVSYDASNPNDPVHGWRIGMIIVAFALIGISQLIMWA